MTASVSLQVDVAIG